MKAKINKTGLVVMKMTVEQANVIFNAIGSYSYREAREKQKGAETHIDTIYESLETLWRDQLKIDPLKTANDEFSRRFNQGEIDEHGQPTQKSSDESN